MKVEEASLEKSLDKKEESFYNPKTFLDIDTIKKLDEQYILHTYSRMPLTFRYGSGEFLYDSEGKEYIDFLSGIAVTGIGHAQADVLAALNYQAELLWHTSNIFYSQQQVILAKALIEISFPGKVFFCNSGTEANEAALKLMKAWGSDKNKNRIIALKESFHGRTCGSISITGQEKIRNGFGELLGSITFVEANNIESLKQSMDDKVCGIILEPVVGEGGVLPLDKEFILTARELADTHRAILCMDEIQTGIGRTGTYFCYQQWDIQPDILTMAKALGGGFPVGAMVVSEKYQDVFKMGMHGSTFGGNHLAMAVAYEVLRTIEANDILNNVNIVSKYFFQRLREIQRKYADKISEVRGKGLMIGIVLRKDIPARPLMKKALEQNLIIGRADENVIRLLPPLVIRRTVAEKGLDRLEKLFTL